ncbi:ABC transporter permease subunit [Brevibacterium sp. 5221]|uniref:ABC transporter permease subunit n=1 Tax=Brevibacterium rongguiense TaxID=2695267 RepID=A0A6N9H6Y1_9MICO|nr:MULTISPECIES: amino acid ABC transporter permease [Brevibacterium]MYM19516.1 ABC transporter permease subunit [Brevibacterium rongguiense]WAL39978.1 amino acid ABC transporter permease [Brevibacterium sp. BRM-1]
MTFFADAQEFLPALLGGLRVSLLLTLLSLLFGLPLATVLAFGIRSHNPVLHWLSVAFVEVGRGAPALVVLQFMYFGLPTAGLTLSAMASATLALTWTTGAYCAEYLRGGLSGVPQGEIEGAEALGMTWGDTLRYIVIPQGWRIALPSLMGFAVILFQTTSLAYTVTVPELMSQAYSIGSSTFKYLTVFVLAGILYAMISIPATWLSVLVEKRLNKHL